MALVHCDPFAHYTTAQQTDIYTPASGTPSIGAFGPSGGPGFRFAGNSGHSVDLLGLPASGAVCLIQADLRIGNNPLSTNVFLGVELAGLIQCTVDLNADRTLAVHRGFGGSKVQLGSNSTYVVPLNTFIHLAVKVTIANTGGSMVVHVWEAGDTAPQVVLNVTGVDTQDQPTATWDGINLGANNATSTDWANLVVLDGSGSSANDVLGPCDVTALFASARTTAAVADWTRSSGTDPAALVDEAAPDDDATYLEATTAGQTFAVSVDVVPVSNRVIYGAMLYPSSRRTVGAPTSALVGYQGGTVYLGASGAHSAAYTYLRAPYSAMPNGAAFTTPAAFDLLQWGLRLTTSATAARCTQLVVAVVQSRIALIADPDADAPIYHVTIGDETGITPLLATFRIQETIDAPDTLIADVFSVSAPYFRPTVGLSVFVTENGVRIFGGSVTGVRERGLVGPGPAKIVVEIQASSYEINAKRRVVTAAFNTGTPPGTDTIGDAFAALVTDWYAELGVTLHPDQVAGPVLPAASFERERGDAINAQLAGSVGYLQSIDFENRLRAWLPGDILAPENYDEGVNPELLTGDVEVERQLQNGYANRVILEGASIRVNDQVDSFTGDGVEDTFPLTYRMIEHYGYVTANGIPENFGTAPGQWVLDTASLPHTIRRASGALTAGHVVTVKYNGLFVPEGLAEDAGEIATYGLWEHIEVVTAAPTTLSAQAFAEALLAEKLASKDEIVTLPTRALGFHPGQVMTIATTSRALSGEYLLTQVDTQSEAGDIRLWRRITAAKSLNNNHDWRRVYQQWAGASAEDPAAPAVTTAPGTGGGGVGLHAPTHESGGVDPIQLDDLAAPSDNTDLNVSTSLHGLTPKITGADGVVLTKSGAAAIWATPTGGGGGSSPGGYQFIEEITPTGVATITFAALGTYTHLEIRWAGRATDGATSVTLNLNVNGDTGANYDRQLISGGGSTAAANQALGGTNAAVGTLASAGATAGRVGGGTLALMDYRGTTFNKIMIAHDAYIIGTASGNFSTRVFGINWRSTAAITSITLSLSAGNFAAGSKFSLYGLASTAAAGGLLHAPTHSAGGTDPVKLDDLAAPDDNTDLDVSSSAHGLAPKIGGLLRAAADGDVLTVSGQRSVWAALPETGGGLHAPTHELGGSDPIAIAELTGWATWFNQPVRTTDGVTFAGAVRLAGSGAPQMSVHIGSGTDVPYLGYEGLSVQAANGPAQISARDATSNVEGGIFAHPNGNTYMGSWTNHPVRIRVNNTDRMTVATNGDITAGASFFCQGLGVTGGGIYIGGYLVTVTANCSIPGTGGGTVIPGNVVYYDLNNPWSVYQNFPNGIAVGGVDVAGALAWLNQSVKTDASPTFANLTLTTNLTLGNTLTVGTNISAPRYDSGGEPGHAGPTQIFFRDIANAPMRINVRGGIVTYLGPQ